MKFLNGFLQVEITFSKKENSLHPSKREAACSKSFLVLLLLPTIVNPFSRIFRVSIKILSSLTPNKQITASGEHILRI